jgi:hypothetical protein
MININIHSNEQKIPSFLELRRIEFLKALGLDNKRILELNLDCIPVCTGLEEYDAVLIYSTFSIAPRANLIDILTSFKSCIRERLIVVEDLPVNLFTAKILEIREILFPSYTAEIRRLINQLKQIGFKKVERKIWRSQIPLSEDEVAREIRILNRIALERKIDLSEELQKLMTLYRASNPVFKVFAIHSFLI